MQEDGDAAQLPGFETPRCHFVYGSSVTHPYNREFQGDKQGPERPLGSLHGAGLWLFFALVASDGLPMARSVAHCTRQARYEVTLFMIAPTCSDGALEAVYCCDEWR